MINTFDLSGSIFGFCATIGYVYECRWVWLFSFIAVGIDAKLCFMQGIYANCFLQLIYLILTAYGAYNWYFGESDNKSDLKVTSISKKAARFLSIALVICIAAFFLILKLYVKSTEPFIDVITTVCSLVAQWLLCRKIIQCWHLWFIVDCCYVIMYLNQNIWGHAFLNLLYLFMAVIGYRNWKNNCEFFSYNVGEVK